MFAKEEVVRIGSKATVLLRYLSGSLASLIFPPNIPRVSFMAYEFGGIRE
jgi:hypothetical protein